MESKDLALDNNVANLEKSIVESFNNSIDLLRANKYFQFYNSIFYIFKEIADFFKIKSTQANKKDTAAVSDDLLIEGSKLLAMSKLEEDDLKKAALLSGAMSYDSLFQYVCNAQHFCTLNSFLTACSPALAYKKYFKNKINSDMIEEFGKNQEKYEVSIKPLADQFVTITFQMQDEAKVLGCEVINALGKDMYAEFFSSLTAEIRLFIEQNKKAIEIKGADAFLDKNISEKSSLGFYYIGIALDFIKQNWMKYLDYVVSDVKDEYKQHYFFIFLKLIKEHYKDEEFKDDRVDNLLSLCSGYGELYFKIFGDSTKNSTESFQSIIDRYTGSVKILQNKRQTHQFFKQLINKMSEPKADKKKAVLLFLMSLKLYLANSPKLMNSSTIKGKNNKFLRWLVNATEFSFGLTKTVGMVELDSLKEKIPFLVNLIEIQIGLIDPKFSASVAKLLLPAEDILFSTMQQQLEPKKDKEQITKGYDQVVKILTTLLKENLNFDKTSTASPPQLEETLNFNNASTVSSSQQPAPVTLTSEQVELLVKTLGRNDEKNSFLNILQEYEGKKEKTGKANLKSKLESLAKKNRLQSYDFFNLFVLNLRICVLSQEDKLYKFSFLLHTYLTALHAHEVEKKSKKENKFLRLLVTAATKLYFSGNENTEMMSKKGAMGSALIVLSQIDTEMKSSHGSVQVHEGTRFKAIKKFINKIIVEEPNDKDKVCSKALNLVGDLILANNLSSYQEAFSKIEGEPNLRKKFGAEIDKLKNQVLIDASALSESMNKSVFQKPNDNNNYTFTPPGSQQ